MEKFQRLTRFAFIPAALVLSFAACSGEETSGGNSAGSGGTNATAGTASGSPAASGTNATVGGSTAGQSTTAGSSTTGGAGASTGGQNSGGSSPGASGSGGSSPGASGSGGASGGSGGGATAMGCNGFTGKFCDDFEAQTEGQAPQGDFTVDGPITVDTSKAYSGTKSLKITKPSPTGQLRFTKQFPLNDLHGRAMFYVGQVPQGSGNGPHWDLVVAIADTGHNWEIGGMYGKWLFIIDPPDTGVGAGAFPTGKWFCLQWQYKFAGAGQDHTFVAKLDGTVMQNGMFTGSDAEGHHWDAGPWKNLSIGLTSYQDPVDTDVWMDDIAFGEQEIACPAPK
jgi:hypothetical protein